MVTSTLLNPSSVENPHEHIVEAGNEVLSETSPMEFEDDLSLKTSPIVSNTVDSFTGSKCLGVSSRRMTRSMKRMDDSKNSSPLLSDKYSLNKGTLSDPEVSRKDLNDALSNNKKTVNVVDCDMKSESSKIISRLSGGYGKGSKETASCSKGIVLELKLTRKQIDQNSDAAITKGTRNKLASQSGISNQMGNKDDVDVSGESHISTRMNTSVGVVDVNDSMRTALKNGRNNKKNRVERKLPVKRKLIASPKSAAIPNQEGNKDDADVSGESRTDTRINTSVGVVDVNDGMRTDMKTGRNKKKNGVERKLPIKRKLIASPESAKFTSSRGKKGSEDRYGSANIVSLESFSGKKSRSGRVVLPPLQFWRNQTVVYDEDRQMCGVQDPK